MSKEKIYRTLSFWQPQASLVALRVLKVVLRGYGTDYRGPAVIHATSKQPTEFDSEELKRALVECGHIETAVTHLVEFLKNAPHGVVLAKCNITDCQRLDLMNEDDKALITPAQEFIQRGAKNCRYLWTLEEIQLLPEPLPMSGIGDLWRCKLPAGEVSDDLVPGSPFKYFLNAKDDPNFDGIAEPTFASSWVQKQLNDREQQSADAQETSLFSDDELPLADVAPQDAQVVEQQSDVPQLALF